VECKPKAGILPVQAKSDLQDQFTEFYSIPGGSITI
jgi:hypothetical protein